MTNSKWITLPLLLAASLACVASEGPLIAYEAVEAHMGTLFRIKLYASSENIAQKAFRAAFDRVDQVDKTLSDYLPQSELSRITDEAVDHEVRVSEDLFRVAQASQNISLDTQGAFDLTLGPLTHLWRQARRERKAPEADAIELARERCGYQKLHLNAAARTLKFDAPQMLLDAGGIAKGYAADEALRVLDQLGLHSALVAASGDLAFSDAPPGKAGWEVGIDSFDQASKPFTHVLTLSHAAVSTSGNSEQHLEVGGRTYSHIIDPRTGVGLENGLTVTTIASNGLTADPAATAISVLGCEKGLAFAERQPNLAAYILLKHRGDTQSFKSVRFQALMQRDARKEIKND